MSGISDQWTGVLNHPSTKKRYAEAVTGLNEELGAFLSFDVDDPRGREPVNGPLAGIPLGVKDNIAVEGRPLSCGSKMLENLVAPYTATAVERLENAGASVVGKTNLDEFGMGSSTENSALGTTVNPWNRDRVAGGSSGGSACAVAGGMVPLALGSDTGGSVRQPANFCGVYGLKPTYGSVSRYGLTAYASSLDVVGAISADIDLLETAFQTMAGQDERDQSSVSGAAPEPGGRRLMMLDVDEGMLEPEVAESYRAAAESLKAAGYTVEKLTLPSLELVVPAYYTIATAEASANLARYNGIRYGHAPAFAENPVELMKQARHEGFGDEVKLRILLGTYVLRSGFQDQYYGRAQKIRTLIRKELAGAFRQTDLILMPVFPTQAFGRGADGMDDYRQRIADVFTCLANLTGTPALAVPTEAAGGLPTGIQLLAPAFAEDRLFSAARDMAGDFPLIMPEGALDIRSLA